jgi:hypothetical protein
VVKHLVNQDVTRVRVIAVFHERRVLSPMRWARRLDEMVPNVPLEGTVLVMEELNREEIKKRIKSALGSIPSDAALDLHPPMRPDDGFHRDGERRPSSLPLFPRAFCVSFSSLDLGLEWL